MASPLLAIWMFSPKKISSGIVMVILFLAILLTELLGVDSGKAAAYEGFDLCFLILNYLRDLDVVDYLPAREGVVVVNLDPARAYAADDCLAAVDLKFGSGNWVYALASEDAVWEGLDVAWVAFSEGLRWLEPLWLSARLALCL